MYKAKVLHHHLQMNTVLPKHDPLIFGTKVCDQEMRKASPKLHKQLLNVKTQDTDLDVSDVRTSKPGQESVESHRGLRTPPELSKQAPINPYLTSLFFYKIYQRELIFCNKGPMMLVPSIHFNQGKHHQFPCDVTTLKLYLFFYFFGIVWVTPPHPSP